MSTSKPRRGSHFVKDGSVAGAKNTKPSTSSRAAKHNGAIRKPHAVSVGRKNENLKSKKKKGFILIVLAIIVLTLAIGYLKLANKKAPVNPGQPVAIEIPQGASGKSIGKILVDAQVLGSYDQFVDAVKNQNAGSSLKPGKYMFVTADNPDEVVAQLVKGPSSQSTKLTIAEGLTVAKCAQKTQETLGISAQEFIDQAHASYYVDDYPFLAQAKNDSLEGFLFPKTYEFGIDDTSADKVIRTMLDQYQKEVASIDFAQAASAIHDTYGVDMDEYDFITLASIIEREAGKSEDFPYVASVFYNRLEKGMPLQSDATTEYEVGREVKVSDLKVESPYNTYLNAGLTPTPICSAGMEAIQASINPPKTDYLYFLLTQNTTAFSTTYDQHLQAIEDSKKA